MRREPNRPIMPKMPAGAYQTFTVSAPLASHWTRARCDEVHCLNHLNGFQTLVDERTQLGQRQAHYIRHDRTRGHTEARTPEGLTAFTFPPGQQCFETHRRRMEREEVFIQRGGDWRGNPAGVRRVHANADDWVDAFANHQDKLATAAQQG